MPVAFSTREGGRRNPLLRAPVLVSLGFLAAILVGTVLLSQPSAVAVGRAPLSFVQALFTATSAVCVTGLTVVGTAQDLSLHGQAAVLVMFQLGGLGVMTLAFLVFESLRGNTAQESGEVLESTLTGDVFRGNPRRALTMVLGGTLILELGGFLALLPAMSGEAHPAWKALFLSVSAFCNAGFDNLDHGLAPYSGSWAVGLPLLTLWLAGGLGFIVPAALWDRGLFRVHRRLSLSARLILIAGLFLAILGPLLFLLSESFGGSLSGLPWSERLLLALFQGNTTRTAGFSMLDLSQVRRLTVILMIPFMLVGGSPGGTAGGMKTTTVWIFLATLAARVRGHRRVVLAGRTIPIGVIRRAVLVCTSMVAIHFLATLLLAAFEPGENLPFEDLAFEAASALGTVGLSTGVTPELGTASHLVLVLTMLIGRLGPLTVAYALLRRKPEKHLVFPPADVPVG